MGRQKKTWVTRRSVNRQQTSSLLRCEVMNCGWGHVTTSARNRNRWPWNKVQFFLPQRKIFKKLYPADGIVERFRECSGHRDAESQGWEGGRGILRMGWGERWCRSLIQLNISSHSLIVSLAQTWLCVLAMTALHKHHWDGGAFSAKNLSRIYDKLYINVLWCSPYPSENKYHLGSYYCVICRGIHKSPAAPRHLSPTCSCRCQKQDWY